MKHCPNCGAEVTEEMNNCPSCGSDLKTSDGDINKNENEAKVEVVNQATNNNGFKPEERSIALSIVLTLITCGIYGYYWLYTITEETNILSKENKTAGGGLTILLVIITCGIYGIYWYYKTGKKLEEATGEDESVLYLILGIFGLGIINMGLIQDKLNKLAK